MPKERRDRSVSHDRCRGSPYPCSSGRCSSSNRTRPSSKTPLEPKKSNMKEWEDARCPVCMEHPHNAVLLICSSHEKGCRPYMCDTSHRHSNCLDQFRKSFEEKTSSSSSIPQGGDESSTVLDMQEGRRIRRRRNDEEEMAIPLTTHDPLSCENPAHEKLLCPLCRGKIKTWIVNEPARIFMNARLRSCASEDCNYSGTYVDLRKHARQEHPLVRPSEADPVRERNWRRLERQRDLGDLLSTLQSSFGEDRTDSNETVLPIDDRGLLTVFLFIRVFQPEPSTRSSSWSGGGSRTRTRTGAQLSFRRRRSDRLWGENYEGEIGSADRDDEENDQSSDDGIGPWSVLARDPDQSQRRSTPDNLS